MSTLSANEKFDLISRNLAEILGEDRLKKLLAERDLKLYWGTATTGKPHIAYFVPMSKIADFLKAGCHVTILFADLHAYLDNMKAPWELLAHRVEYYAAIIKSMLRSLSVPLEKLHFVRGTDFQLSREYTLDVYKFSSMCGLHDAQRAGAEVVKQVDSPLLSGLLYPGLQALDEEYLKVDAQFGGQDQRKIFVLAKEFLPKLGYAERIHLMNPMVPGLAGTKMSSSEPESKIDLLDDEQAVTNKIKKAFCEAGNVDNNGLLSFMKYVVFPLLELKTGKRTFVIERNPKYGGPVTFESYQALHDAFRDKQLDPVDLKLGVTSAINDLLRPIREDFKTPEMQDLIKRAYPAVESAGNSALDKKKAAKKAEEERPVDVSRLQMLVGQITAIEDHSGADSLYVTKMSFGGVIPDRQVVAGLRKFFPADQLLNRKVVVLCNLAPRAIRGVESNGMIMAASTGEGDATKVELLTVHADTPLGSALTVKGFEPSGELEIVLNPKKKIWETVQPDLAIGDDLAAKYKGVDIEVAGHKVTVASLKGAKLG